MWIEMLTSVGGTEYTYAAGQIVDAPEAIAKDLIQGGHAKPAAVKPSDTAERATSPKPKQAERR